MYLAIVVLFVVKVDIECEGDLCRSFLLLLKFLTEVIQELQRDFSLVFTLLISFYLHVMSGALFFILSRLRIHRLLYVTLVSVF